MNLIIAIFFPILCIPVLQLGMRLHRKLIPFLSLIPSIGSLIYLIRFIHPNWTYTQRVLIPWASNFHINLNFQVDGLSLFFGLLITGIGIIVSIYSISYFHEDKTFRPAAFFSYLCLFMTGMLGAVFSNNLLLLFMFWELTSISSFFLIGYNYTNPLAKNGAKNALYITVCTGLVMFAGFLLLGTYANTFVISEIINYKSVSPLILNICLILIMIGAFGKSAQFPFHMWLPGAMAAPTPISTYLHSAAMVKLGIFLTARLYPFLINSDLWTPLLLTIGFITMIFGAIHALTEYDIKAILAYTTISQLGFLFAMYGFGSKIGLSHDLFHIINHVFYKATLFMMAGIVIHITKTNDIRKMGGLFKKLPFLGIATIIAAAAMAGIPGTSGFISKELLTSQVLVMASTFSKLYWLLPIILIFSGISLLVCSLRIIWYIFIKPTNSVFSKPSIMFQFPAILLASFVLLLGIFPQLFPKFLYNVTGLHIAHTHSALHAFPGFTSEFFFSLSIYLLGILSYILIKYFKVNTSIPNIYLPFQLLFGFLYIKLHQLFNMINDFLHIDKPLDYLYIILSFFVFIMGLLLFPIAKTLILPFLYFDQVGMLETIVALFIVAFTIGVVSVNTWLGKLISLSLAGFLVSILFVIYQAPDLALTQLLIEIVSLVLFLLLLGRFPKYVEKHKHKDHFLTHRKYFALIISVLCAVIMFCLMIIALAQPSSTPIGQYFIDNAYKLAHGRNIVNTILVDFRGFDTMGEITVLVIAMLGVLSLLMKQDHMTDMDHRFWRKKMPPSPILKSIAPYVAIFISVLSIYLFFKGHHEPGGGFIAGVAATIAMILLTLIFSAGEMKHFLKIDPIDLAITGLCISYITSALPLLFGYSFLQHFMTSAYIPLLGKIHIGTPMLFDLGVFLTVFGVSTKIIFVFAHFAESRVSFIQDVDSICPHSELHKALNNEILDHTEDPV